MRVGQNAFRGGIVNQWYHPEMRTSGGVCSLEAPAAALHSTRSGCRVDSKMPKFVCWKAKQFMEEFEQLLRDGFGDSDTWKLCDFSPQPEDVAVG